MPESAVEKTKTTAYRSSPHLGSHNPQHAKYDPMEFVNSIQSSLPSSGNLSSSDFEGIAILGQSAYGEVLLVNQKPAAAQQTNAANGTLTKKVVVLKKINRLKMNKNLVANEVAAATTLKHTGIVKVHDIFKEGVYTYLVMEHLKGVDFFKYLSSKNFAPLKEKEAKRIFKQLVDILLYCHSQGFAHRDVKLENIMFDKKKGKAKLIDFGLCERVYSSPNNKGEMKMCDLWCGSQDYVCPEIIKKESYNGFLADVWSLGTILYIMLYGELPFGFDHRVKALTDGRPHPPLNFADDRNPNVVPDAAKELISSMLHPDPNKRITMEGVSKHRWVKSKTPLEFLSSWSLS